MPDDRTDGRASGSERALVRIVTTAGRPVGVGVLLGRKEILTCAHVVNAALGRDRRSPERPEGSVTVEFPLLPGDQQGPARVTARVGRWLPPPGPAAVPGESGDDDLAGLVVLGGAVPRGAVPARLAAGAPGHGHAVEIFGYPSDPPRPDGAWVPATVRGQVSGGRLQLDTDPSAAHTVQAGYSGSPVIDCATGRVIGILATAPRVGSGGRDSYAVSADRIRRAWPEVGSGGGSARSRIRERTHPDTVTVLHLTDLRFGRDPGAAGGHRDGIGGHPGGADGCPGVPGGRPGAEPETPESLFRRIDDDLAWLVAAHGLRPDLVVVTGDLAEHGIRSELTRARDFLETLAEELRLPRDRVAVVPGEHDVNYKACRAYFDLREADERRPVPPYWPKWGHFSESFERFYADVEGAMFPPDEPWTLFELPELAVVVAGLNSTMAESHLESDHHGWLGEQQLDWFAGKLREYRDRGWLRLGAVHHRVTSAPTGAGAAEEPGSGRERLRDTARLDEALGRPGLLNLLVHGHPRGTGAVELPSGLLALSPGAAEGGAPGGTATAAYQVLVVRENETSRHVRGRSVATGPMTAGTVTTRLKDVGTALPGGGRSRRGRRREDTSGDHTGGGRTAEPGAAHADGFFDRVVEATRARFPTADLAPRPDAGYLRVVYPLDEVGVEQLPVGVVEGEVTEAGLMAFVTGVHARFAAADPQVRSELVYSGAPADPELVTRANRLGIRLRSFVDYQGLLDLRPLVERQTARLAGDRRYPRQLYVPQRFRTIDDDPGRPPREDLLEQVTEWLATDGARFVMLLGDFGRGKTYLLHQLARYLPEHLPGSLPVLVELRTLEKGPSLDALLAQHLYRHRVEGVTEARLRYMIRSGRLVLLFDGFDELELRVGYDNAADYLQTLLQAVTDRAKVVLTSRTQHFRSTAQLRTALGARVASLSASRVAVIEDFSEDQIWQFLLNRHDADEQAARARFDLIADVQDLLGLSHNPRMLSFITELPERRLRDVQSERGAISAAELYRELVDYWLVGERDRQRHRGGPVPLDEIERRDACVALALRLWDSAEPSLPLAEVTGEIVTVLTGLAELRYSPDQAVHAVGSGSLLVRTEDGAFTFVHQSVMEWLVAYAAADGLRVGAPALPLTARVMSPLMVDFFCDLAGHGVARAWAAQQLADPAASQVAKQNALAIDARLGPGTGQNLAGVDLRSQDLSGRSLRNADLRRATLRGMHLVATDLAGADLREADLRQVFMIGGSVDRAQLTDSRWHGAALLGVAGIDSATEAQELQAASVPVRDPAEAMLAPSGQVTCVAASPDGALLALARRSAVELVEPTGGLTLRVLTGHTARVRSVAFSPDGTLLATAGDDRTARIWDTVTGQPRTVLTDHGREVGAVAFSPDGTLLATAGDDRVTRIWTSAPAPSAARWPGTAAGAQRGLLRRHPAGHRGQRPHHPGWQVTSGRPAQAAQRRGPLVTFSPTAPAGHRGDDRVTRIWDVGTGTTRSTLAGHGSGVRSVAFSPDGTLLATAGNDRAVQLWDPTTGQPRLALGGHTGGVRGVAFSPDGSVLATASDDRTARLWDTATGETRSVLVGHGNGVPGVTFSPDGSVLATACTDGTARLWDTATGEVTTTVRGHSAAVWATAFSGDGALLATASDDGTARIWDTATGDPRAVLRGHTDWVRGLSFSPDGSTLATAGADGTARLWQAATGRLRSTLTGHSSRVWAVAFSPDGSALATAGNDGTVRLWEAATGRSRTVLRGHTDGVRSVAFSPDGSTLASAGADTTARIWDAATGRLIATLRGHTDGVRGVSFSSDAALLATAGADGTARIWDTATRRSRAVLHGHTDWVWEAVFSPDAALLATAGADGTVRLWDVATGDPLATLVPLDGDGHAVLLPDGSYKLTGAPGRLLWWAIKLSRFAPGELDPYVPQLRRLAPETPVVPR